MVHAYLQLILFNIKTQKTISYYY